MTLDEIREQICFHGRSLYERGYVCGSSGNISVRVDDRILITPTNSCLAQLEPDRLCLIDPAGNHISGDRPSKELPLHLAIYQARSADRAVVHLHSTAAVTVSCLADIDPADALPPLTAYFVIRVGQLPLAPYFAPGDRQLADAVGRLAKRHRAMLLSNHGPVVSGVDLAAAVSTAEELEEASKVYLGLRGQPFRSLTPQECDELRRRFGG